MADAFVRDGTYETANYGADATLYVKNDATGYHRKSFLMFDVSTITGTVTTAKIRIIPTSVGMSGIVNEAYSVADHSWTETMINWSNQPAAGTMLSSWTVSEVGVPVDIDVTNLVNSALSGDKKIAIVVSSPTNYGANGSVLYGSKENGTASNRPQLMINQ